MKYTRTSNLTPADRWGICFRCGFKKHVKELVKVTEPHSRDYGKIICYKHLRKTNGQDLPFTPIKETMLSNPAIVSPPTYGGYYHNPLDDRVPGKPNNGRAKIEGLTGYIMLRWDAPLDNGSSNITGYFIQRSIPQFLNYVTLVSDTGMNIPTFIDIYTVPAIPCSYRIAAINDFGMGPLSDEIFFPVRYDYGVVSGNSYLMTQPDSIFFKCADGSPLIVKTS